MRRERGIALVTAILVVSLATIASTAILVSANVAVHRAANLQDSEKAWWYAVGVESWVKSVLQRDLEDNSTDTLKDVWARPENVFPVDEGVLRGTVIDLQGRFNLNNLGTPDAALHAFYAAQFERLLGGIEGADAMQAKAIAAAVRDWVDADSEPTGFDGGEDTDYLSARSESQPPQRVPNRPMASVSELLAVKGMTRELYAAIAGHLAALPQYNTPLNVNTATPEVLRSLARTPNPELDKFVEARVETPAANLGEIQSRGIVRSSDVEAALQAKVLAVASSYFMLRAEASIGAGRVGLHSLIYRPTAQQGAPVVLGHSVDTE
jgi:general secretion pathway protein K